MSEVSLKDIDVIFNNDIQDEIIKPIETINISSHDNQNKNKIYSKYKNMSDYNNNANNQNQKKKINFAVYITYWFYFFLILNFYLMYYIYTKPTLEKQAMILYNQNQQTYDKIKSLKQILNWTYK